MKQKLTPALSEPVEGLIRLVRGQRVILDKDLARIYGVTTSRLNQQVRRNSARFPADFCFQITDKALACLMLQFATSKRGRGGRRKLPYAFTEHGAIMAANVLNSQTAVQMSVFVVRAFVKMRETLAQNRQLAAKLAELEEKLTKRLDVHEKAIIHLLDEIRKLMAPSPPVVQGQREIGFHVRDQEGHALLSTSKKGSAKRARCRASDSLYKAKALGRSKDFLSSAQHDAVLYRRGDVSA